MPPVPKQKRQLRPTFLRKWRQYRNMTQEQAAEPLHIDATTLGRIERGVSPYDQPFLEAAAELYGCDVPDLLIRDPTDPEGIWSIWERAEPGQRKQAIELLKVIIGSRAA